MSLASSLTKWMQRLGSGDPMGLAKPLVGYLWMVWRPGAVLWLIQGLRMEFTERLQ
jgi:hypothetical protein